MIEDPIVEEIRRHREAHAAEHGHDLARIAHALRKREQASDRMVLNPGPKRRVKGLGRTSSIDGSSPVKS